MKNNITWKMALATLAIFAVGTVVPGCLGDFVKVQTPAGAVESGVPETLSLNDSVVELTDYAAEQTLIFESWEGRIVTAQDKVAFWNSAIGALTTPESLALFGLNPVGGASLAAVFISGLLIRRPGDKNPHGVSKEKEDSYNEGIKVGSNLIK